MALQVQWHCRWRRTADADAGTAGAGAMALQVQLRWKLQMEWHCRCRCNGTAGADAGTAGAMALHCMCSTICMPQLLFHLLAHRVLFLPFFLLSNFPLGRVVSCVEFLVKLVCFHLYACVEFPTGAAPSRWPVPRQSAIANWTHFRQFPPFSAFGGGFEKVAVFAQLFQTATFSPNFSKKKPRLGRWSRLRKIAIFSRFPKAQPRPKSVTLGRGRGCGRKVALSWGVAVGLAGCDMPEKSRLRSKVAVAVESCG
jgi:hypothetical protein